jgi:hypothetical protein
MPSWYVNMPLLSQLSKTRRDYSILRWDHSVGSAWTSQQVRYREGWWRLQWQTEAVGRNLLPYSRALSCFGTAYLRQGTELNWDTLGGPLSQVCCRSTTPNMNPRAISDRIKQCNRRSLKFATVRAMLATIRTCGLDVILGMWPMLRLAVRVRSFFFFLVEMALYRYSCH